MEGKTTKQLQRRWQDLNSENSGLGLAHAGTDRNFHVYVDRRSAAVCAPWSQSAYDVMFNFTHQFSDSSWHFQLQVLYFKSIVFASFTSLRKAENWTLNHPKLSRPCIFLNTLLFVRWHPLVKLCRCKPRVIKKDRCILLLCMNSLKRTTPESI